MKLEWIEDLLAISEAGSLTEAAARRHISQPAFSRRIRGIEEQLGITLIDRSRRPARPIRAVTDNVEVYRELVSRLRQLPSYLLGTERIVIACQHSLSISAVPGIAEKILRVTPKATIRVRAANRDQCLALLMTQQADFMVAFETDELPAIGHNDFVERKVLARESLLPVIAPGRLAGGIGLEPRAELPLIAYPDDVFLGMLMTRSVVPALSSQVSCKRVVETAFTLGARELARAGLGAAWIPESIAREDISNGRLAVLPCGLEPCMMSLVALRLKAERSGTEEAVWDAIQQFRPSTMPPQSREP